MGIRDCILILLFCVAGGIALRLLLPVYTELHGKQNELEQVQKLNDALTKEHAMLMKQTGDLKNGNYVSIMRVARETFGYCYPHDRIYQFPIPRTTSATKTYSLQ